MRLIKPSVEILPYITDIGFNNIIEGNKDILLEGIFNQIEVAGRTCFKSEDKITKDSAEKFVEMIKKNGHTAMLEHGTVYLEMLSNNQHLYKYTFNPYSRVKKHRLSNGAEVAYITTNYRVLYEHELLDDLQYLCEPTEFHKKRISVRFVCDKGTAYQLKSHRVFSFVDDSENYDFKVFKNISKSEDQRQRCMMVNEITFIEPCWEIDKENIFMTSLEYAEKDYFTLLEYGWKPQQARSVLPNDLKTEVVMTGFVSDWKHFFELRCSKDAHPSMQELAVPLKQMFIDREYIKE